MTTYNPAFGTEVGANGLTRAENDRRVLHTAYEDPTPVAQFRMVNWSKMHMAELRHLAAEHDVRFPRFQVGLTGLWELHSHLHDCEECSDQLTARAPAASG